MPSEQDEMVSELLGPLSKPTEFIWTVYPEEGEYVTMETKEAEGQNKNTSSETVTKAGKCFFDNYAENSDFLHLLMKHFESACTECLDHLTKYKLDTFQVETLLGRIGFISYLYYCGMQEYHQHSWAPCNIFGMDTFQAEHKNDNKQFDISYMVNQRLAKLLAEHVSYEQVQQLAERLLSEDSMTDNRVISVVPGLGVKYSVLKRMLSRANSVPDNAEHVGICFAEDFSGDITLEALLWRIQNELPLHQGMFNRQTFATDLFNI